MKYAIIKWYDSTSSCWSWTCKDDYKAVSSHEVVSCGFVLSEDLASITLVQNIAAVGSADEQYCHVMTIPRCSIASSHSYDHLPAEEKNNE
jgi:hypothetical protein